MADAMQRVHYNTTTEWVGDFYGQGEVERYVKVPAEKAMLVSSELPNGLHAPALDIDIPARLVPSSTPGHSHLYIDIALPWRKYKKLLKALMKAGVIEKGYYEMSVQRKRTQLRTPGFPKGKTPLREY